jgi:hypothetical protein
MDKSLRKQEGALGTKVGGCSFIEGDASHTARGRPLALRIKETEAPLVISFSNARKIRTEH